jgi:hypothetical protein
VARDTHTHTQTNRERDRDSERNGRRERKRVTARRWGGAQLMGVCLQVDLALTESKGAPVATCARVTAETA